MYQALKIKSLLTIFASITVLTSNVFGQSNTPCGGGGAPSLPVNTTCSYTTGTTIGATQQSNAANFGATTCGSSGQDVWYSFIAPASGDVTIQTQAGGITDGVMELYWSDCASYTQIECDDDDGPGSMPEIQNGTLTPGDTYYIRFWEYGGNNNGTFDICIIDNVIVPNIPPGGIPIAAGTVNACSGTFYDTGGLNSYSPNEDIEMTICSSAPGQSIILDFTSFDIEGTTAGDVFCLYNGLDNTAPSLGCYSNDSPLVGIVAASNPTGCITVWFQSTATIQLGGWVADISCQTLCQDVIATLNTFPSPDADGIIRICKGENVQFNGVGVYPENNNAYNQSDGASTFTWDMGDGSSQTGTTVNQTYPAEGGYLIQLEIEDIEGCSNDNDIDQLVYVSTTPSFAGSIGAPDPICLGEQADMTAIVTPVTFEKICTPPAFPPLALPDGSGVSYSTSVNLDCYLPGQTLTDINDLLSICVTMEHSYMGDLDIVIECPDGTQVTLVDYPNGGGGTFLGVPVDNDAQPNNQGVGWNYCWDPSATNGSWADNTGGTLPSGSYESLDPLNSLIGCPMNGDWSIIITDNLSSDNGFIFDWNISFDPSIISTSTFFTPVIVNELWLADPTIVSGTNPITVEPITAGSACYVFEVEDDFGCFYDTTVCIIVNPSPVIDPIADLISCADVVLPVITGVDLTGNEAYYTGPLGTGTQYNPGDVISVNTSLYIYDVMTVAPFCDDEEIVNIIINPLDIDAGADQVLCLGSGSVTIGGDPVTSTEGVNYSWSPTGGSGVTDYTGAPASQDNGQTTVSPGITTTYTLTVSLPGCVLTEDVIVVVDAAPTASNPTPLSFQCITDVPAPNVIVVNDEADDITVTPIVTFIGETTIGTCPQTITRTYRVTDGCSNFIEVTQIITVNDNVAPVLAVTPADIIVQCSGDVPAMTNLAWTDNCDGAGTVTGTDGALVGGTCGGTITRTWTYTDACGNNATATQTITINDNVVPVLAAAPANITVECTGDVPAMTNLAWTDNCDGAGTVTGTDGALVGGPCGGTITRTWTYTDACGNVATTTQTITVDDTTPPTASNPAPQTGTPPPFDANQVLDEADNCGIPTVTNGGDVSNGGTCPEIITRTYIITDVCGNTTTVTQTFTIGDAIIPTASNPTSITVDCIGNVPTPDPLVVTDEADNGITPVVTWEDDTSDGNTCPEVISRRYRVTDDCGNFIFVTQTITVLDITAPTFAAAPANATVECIGDIPAMTNLTWTDNCDGTGNVAGTDVSDGLSCPETITRTWTFTDACGNNVTSSQTITVIDTQAPVFTAPPATANVECIGDVPAMTNLNYTDNCDPSGDVAGTDVSDGLSCPETITRTWSFTDACGNNATVTQSIVVLDTQVPVFAAPPATSNVECIGDVPAMTNLTWTDNCDGTASVAGTDVSDGLTCPETITRTWTFTDACGNNATVSQSIVVNDVTLPTATDPATTTVPGGPAPAVDITVVIDEADNCTVNPVVDFVSESTDGAACPETITRVYSVTDDCGNTINVTHLILITDPFPPTASNPLPINVECIGDVPASDILVVTDEADNQGVPTVAFVSDVSDGLSCPETITRTYSVTDACGGVITVVQTITVLDVTVPTFAAAPAPVTVECVGDVPAMTNLTWTDNCDGTGNVAGTDVSDGLSCPETITRTWIFTDACGNNVTSSQTITVIDTQAPVFTVPPITANVECIGDVPAMTNLNYTDNCDPSGNVAGTDVSDGLSCPETITRTWTFTDACGNNASVSQTIIVLDTQVPVFAVSPATANVECIGDVPAMTNLNYTDNCDPSGNVAGTDVSDGLTCPETITRTWTFTDACGNNTTVTQSIVVNDITLPTASNPATTTVPGGAAPAVDITVVIDEADNCTVNPTVVFISESTDGATCPETITRIYSVTDACGNTINVTHLILITDPIFPSASNPLPVTVECIGDVPAVDILVVTDEADNQGVPTVTWVDDVSDGLTCPETITRTYLITDICGNTITVAQTITVNDITNPTASNPVTVNVECIGDVPANDITVVTDEADNCTVNPIVAWVSDNSDGLTCPETITRTFSITDDCGNQITVDQLIIVNDITNPTASNPITVNIECIGDVPLTDITVVTDEADNCTVNPVVTWVSDNSDGLTCPETITRTYSITDDCGNQITVDQLIIVNDITNPTASNPIGISFQLITDVPAPDVTEVTDEADNCTVNPVVAFVSDVSDGLTCPETITRTYSITDACGNQITVTQTIIVSDLIFPTASNPVTTNVECIGDVPAVDILVVTDEVDNAGAPTVAFVSESSDGLSCPETITRVYSVTDACGNQITVDHLIVVNDVTNPTASNPVTVNVECIGDVPANDITVVTDELDNCTVNPVVVFVADVSDGLTCPETITRTYSITDDCGNQITVDQLIIVNDITNPMASNPVPVNVECIGDVPAFNVNVVVGETDNCTAIPTVAFVSDVSNGQTCPEVITRTYSVTDDCGNQTLVTQTITVNDVTAPVASNPVSVSVPGSMDVPNPDITVVVGETDNCTANPIVAFVSDVTDGNVCNGEIITRTYSITDDCGNQTLVTQEITILAVTPPISANDTLVCENESALLVANNPMGVPISWNNGIQDSVSFFAASTIMYTVTADNLGCINTATATVTIEPLPTVQFFGDELSGCAPLTVTFNNQSVGASNLVNCVWNFEGATDSVYGCNSVSYTFPYGGTYDVTLTTTSLNGCSNSATYADYIYVEDIPVAAFTASSTELTTILAEVEFTNQSTNATNYEWSFGDFSSTTVENPIHLFPDVSSGSYVVQLIAYSSLGCKDSVRMIISVEEELIFYVPNAFTPDGDAYNNTFQPVFTSGFDPYDFHMTLYNRWGEVVFESFDADFGWDGTYGGKLMQDGSYVWKIEFKLLKDDTHVTKTGHFSILR